MFTNKNYQKCFCIITGSTLTSSDKSKTTRTLCRIVQIPSQGMVCCILYLRIKYTAAAHNGNSFRKCCVPYKLVNFNVRTKSTAFNNYEKYNVLFCCSLVLLQLDNAVRLLLLLDIRLYIYQLIYIYNHVVGVFRYNLYI